MTPDRRLSFGWTTPALLSGRKTRTTRDWEPAYAQLFREGTLVAAWDKSPKFGGKQVATLRLTRDPYRQNSNQIPDNAYETEGFAYLDEQGWRPLALPGDDGQVTKSKVWRRLFDRWRSGPVKHQWVVEFVLQERLVH